MNAANFKKAKNPEIRTYWTRNMPVELHRRLKILASVRGRTLEETVNDVLEVGLGAIGKGEEVGG